MKKIKQLICVVLALVLCMMPVHSASAAENASRYLSSYVAYCYYDGTDNVSVWFEVEGVGYVPYLGVLSIDLQEQIPGTNKWETVLYIDNFADSSLLSLNDDFHHGHVEYDEAVEGRLYQAIVCFWGGGAEIGDSRYYLTPTIIANP